MTLLKSHNPARGPREATSRFSVFALLRPPRHFLPVVIAIAALVALCAPAFAQDRPAATISVDASTFAVSQNDRIVFSVPHFRRKDRAVLEHDQITIADFNGHQKDIVLPDRFMPTPPLISYVVKSLAWSPDGRRIAASMMVFPVKPGERRETEKQLQRRERREQHQQENTPKFSLPPNGTEVVALFDDDGHEIRVQGSNTRFIEKASHGAWLADGQTVVYLAGIGPYKIARVTPADGKTAILFGGHPFDQVVWDAPRNQAFAVGSSLSPSGRPELFQLDLLHETVRPIAPAPQFQGQLTVSASGQQLGFFIDGDTIEIYNLADPNQPIRVRTGPGKFEFGPDGRRILLKRGSLGDSGDLIWVGLHDNSWVPIIHDLEFHEFEIAPDGSALVVMDPGRGVLKVYRF